MLNDSDRSGGIPVDAGLTTVIALMNEVAVESPDDQATALRSALASDPPSVARLSPHDVAPMRALAERLASICTQLVVGDRDDAAHRVNEMLSEHSAHPHLALEDGRWRLHHHPAEAELVPMWTAICADAVARLIAADVDHRLGRCDADDCDRFYLDASKNASRRFCSTTCQNRVKAAAFRQRRRPGG